MAVVPKHNLTATKLMARERMRQEGLPEYKIKSSQKIWKTAMDLIFKKVFDGELVTIRGYDTRIGKESVSIGINVQDITKDFIVHSKARYSHKFWNYQFSPIFLCNSMKKAGMYFSFHSDRVKEMLNVINKDTVYDLVDKIKQRS